MILCIPQMPFSDLLKKVRVAPLECDLVNPEWDENAKSDRTPRLSRVEDLKRRPNAVLKLKSNSDAIDEVERWMARAWVQAVSSIVCSFEGV